MTTKDYLQQLVGGQDLSQTEARELVNLLTDSQTSSAQIGGLLSALSGKGETREEITGLILGMREKMQRISTPVGAIDVCGTGGDGKHTFNISTAAAFVLAGAGVRVVKHGNRAASSKCGSADVLEALGIAIQLSPREAEAVLRKVGMVFLFAPVYHSAFKHVGQIRKELGIKTVFNLLGPFASPAGVTRQMIGVPSKKTARLLSRVAATLSYEHVCILSSEDGMDEVSLFAPTYVYEVKGRNIREYTIVPEALGFTSGVFEQIVGKDGLTNAEMIVSVLSGAKDAAREIVVLNSALGCVVAGKVQTLQEGLMLARQSIDSGAAMRVLEGLRKETNTYASHA